MGRATQGTAESQRATPSQASLFPHQGTLIACLPDSMTSPQGKVGRAGLALAGPVSEMP